MEELKQKNSAENEKLKRFVSRSAQHRQNEVFRHNKKVLYEKFGGKR